MDTVTFVICTERGILEPMSVTLIKSLRQFGGSLKDAPVLSYQPRPAYEISAETRRALEQLEVTLITEPLNKKYAHYPQGNKPFVCAHAEQHASTEFVVFLDSDMVVLSEPYALQLPTDKAIGLRPTDKSGVGTTGPSDSNYSYWRSLYELLRIDEQTINYVRTTVDQKSVHAYWNSGVMSVRRSSGIFSRWCHNFELVMNAKLKPKQGVFHTDQTTLAATLMQQNTPVEILPATYNYPFHLHELMPPGERITALREATLLHYHKMFHQDVGMAQLAQLEDDAPKEWLAAQVGYLRSEMPVVEQKKNWFDLVQNKITAWLR